MKLKIIISASLIFLIIVSILIYNRYKTQRLEHLIGANQYRVEEYLNYPNELVTLDKIDLNNVNEKVNKIINSNNLTTSKPALRYTLTGSIRKQVFWLIDEGDGYYVIEAIDTNK